MEINRAELLGFADGQPERGFFANKVEQDPDAGVSRHLLHCGDEICKWARVHFNGLACLKIFQSHHPFPTLSHRARRPVISASGRRLVTIAGHEHISHEHRQKSFKSLPLQIAIGNLMVVGLKLHDVP